MRVDFAAEFEGRLKIGDWPWERVFGVDCARERVVEERVVAIVGDGGDS